jgi:hypothetical protein
MGNRRILGEMQLTLNADRRKLLAQMLAGKTTKASETALAITRHTGMRDIPLSFAQEALWFVDLLESQHALHSVPCAVRLTGELDVPTLTWSLNEIVQRHESLRTTFKERDGRPFQVVTEHYPFAIDVIDLRELYARDAENQAQRIVTEEAHRSFDLERGPLFRFLLVLLCNKEQILMLNFHHLVTDGWSMSVFTRELDQLYKSRCNGETLILAELPVQMKDVALWQRERMHGSELESHLSYWRKVVGGGLPMLHLPTDHLRSDVPSFHGQHHPIELSGDLSDALRALSRRHGVTTFMTLMAAFETLLHHRTGQDDIVIGTAIADRNHEQLENLIGFLINMLVLRTDLSGNPEFRELVHRVKETTLGAYTNKDLPLTQLVKEIQPERDLGRTPLFQVEFSLLTPEVNPAVYGYGLGSGVAQTSELLGLVATTFPVRYDNARYDLAVFLWDMPDSISGVIEYRTDLFERETIDRMAEDFKTVLHIVAERPHVTLDELVSHLEDVSERRNVDAVEQYDQSLRRKLQSIRRRRSTLPAEVEDR